MDRAFLSRADFTGAHLQGAKLVGAIAERACFDHADLSRARLSGANLVSASLEDACLAKAEMEFALMANVTLRGACLREADMSGAQLDAAVLIGTDLRKANLRGADSVMQSWTRATSVMPGSGVPSWWERRCAVPICAVRIYAWQSWTVRICPMPIWIALKA